MTVHRTLPSEIEPEALHDLIDDCRALPASTRPSGARAFVPPARHAGPVRIPDSLVGIADGYEGHG